MTREEREIRSIKDSYVRDWISLDEFETRVWDVLTGKWSPMSAMATVMKEVWTEGLIRQTSDAPGSVDVYTPSHWRHDWGDGKGHVHSISLDEHAENLKARGLEAEYQRARYMAAQLQVRFTPTSP